MGVIESKCCQMEQSVALRVSRQQNSNQVLNASQQRQEHYGQSFIQAPLITEEKSVVSEQVVNKKSYQQCSSKNNLNLEDQDTRPQSHELLVTGNLGHQAGNEKCTERLGQTIVKEKKGNPRIIDFLNRKK